MRYLRIEIDEPSGAPGWGEKLVHAALKALLPAANPDLEKLYDRVRVWWLEIEDTGEPIREIGFDVEGQPIVLGPVGPTPGCSSTPPMTGVIPTPTPPRLARTSTRSGSAPFQPSLASRR